jgi:ribosome biogenesis SPOUT family RNA methylase Rps3
MTLWRSSLANHPSSCTVVPLEKISYVDYPEILINEHERTEMPFRYVVDAKGEPIMPDVSQSFSSLLSAVAR